MANSGNLRTQWGRPAAIEKRGSKGGKVTVHGSKLPGSLPVDNKELAEKINTKEDSL
jgi:hypothetical protein